MQLDELRTAWKRTEALLQDARAHLSQTAESACADELHHFEEFLQHSELERALDSLDEVVNKSRNEPAQVLELLAEAADWMGLDERRSRYDEMLTRARVRKFPGA
jgi:hypothetical protein